MMVYDDIYFNNKENIIIGPALINAYNYERKSSIFPRLIIDPKLVVLKKDSFEKSPSEMEGNIGDYVYEDILSHGFIYLGTKNDFDGLYFIDYLEISYMFDCHPPNNRNDWIKILSQHKNSIQYFLQKNDVYSDKSKNTSIYQKINWLKNYHNLKIQQKMRSPHEKGKQHFREYDNLII